jgi:hypothetical protein
LTEAVVYGVLSLLAVGLLGTLLVESRRVFGQSTATFLVDRAFDRALIVLRRDLAETSLTSIRVYPGPPGTPQEHEPPGLTFIAAGGEVTPQGVPRWNRHVFYTLKGESTAPGVVTAPLVRWEKPLEKPSGEPVPTSLLPSQTMPGAAVDAVLRDVQQPRTQVPDIEESKVGARGGFQVTFVRRSAQSDLLSPWNPGEATLGKGGLSYKGNTGLVEVELRVWRPADSLSASQYVVVRCRISPRTRI